MFAYLLFFLSVSIVIILYAAKIIVYKYAALLITLIMIVFAAVRFNIGWDYPVYLEILEYYQRYGVIIYERNEYLSNLLYTLSINTHIYFFFIISSIIIYYLINKTFYIYSKNYFICALLFISFPLFYLNSFSIIRNFIAISICFYAVKYIIEKSKLKFLIAILIATMFHSSAIIMLIGFLPMFFNITPIVSLIVMVVIVLLEPLWKYILMNIDIGVYELYIENSGSSDGQTMFLVIILIYTYSLMAYMVKKFKNREFNIFFFMLSLGVSIFLVFWGEGTISHRLSLYFTIYLPLVVSYFMNNQYKFVYFYILSSLLFLFTIYFYSTLESEAYVPYKTIFNNFF